MYGVDDGLTLINKNVILRQPPSPRKNLLRAISQRPLSHNTR
ncbi:hypothetical protein YPPY47_3028 [Yersinia pestis PY-47]|nr:hypothetical protein YPPY06_2965 [Yersinia pestis PY-06]EIR87091.1 hypothetical protein YPPY36_3073 [Yersinia pestis PY-36]EIS03662.1 hypothetical protein YPPY47_3028 [Yersinia pestis PY-47]EIS17515.1 hypothetical protein YPPY53_2992 [Yersinia pestis PY-53]EIS40504.1 hypothetical protein YPPY58_2989 [Yersinia pestis PY-58]EIS59592.1 hypothetical protein YPPY64_3019 [Yersinia pestis PY-64]EIS66380.1 hypothetical protein YPPY65_2968 [Yersinia pestis PY-65]EIT05036.1 hypothetical protein YPP